MIFPRRRSAIYITPQNAKSQSPNFQEICPPDKQQQQKTRMHACSFEVGFLSQLLSHKLQVVCSQKRRHTATVVRWAKKINPLGLHIDVYLVCRDTCSARTNEIGCWVLYCVVCRLAQTRETVSTRQLRRACLRREIAIHPVFLFALAEAPLSAT